MEAAFFDLDKTVIARAAMVAFGRPLYREGLISRWVLLRALYGQIVYLYVGADEARLARMQASVLALTKGWERDRVSQVVREALEEVIEPIVFDEAMQLIRDHQRAGRPVYLVSASPEEIVAPLARYLAVDGHIATRPDVDERGRYAGTVAFYAYGPNKAVAMRSLAAERGIDLSRSFAYSDSVSDMPMLTCVGHPVAVNPDRQLLRLARSRSWDVRWFVRKVRLRDRVPVPRSRPAAAVGGGLAATMASVTVWWWFRREPIARPHAGGEAIATDQTARTFLAATAARAMRMANISSFFMAADPTPRRARRPRARPDRCRVGGGGRESNPPHGDHPCHPL